MWLMFDNAWVYNKKTSRVYKYCSKLAEVFEEVVDEGFRALGYCCGQRVSGWSYDLSCDRRTCMYMYIFKQFVSFVVCISSSSSLLLF